MKRNSNIIIIFSFIIILMSSAVWAEEKCKTCHNVETINKKMASVTCSQCHQGNPKSTNQEEAHSGDFYPDPGSMWAAPKACGGCHPGYVDRLKKSLHATSAGILSGLEWTWGLKEEIPSRYGVRAVEDKDGPVPVVGTEKYKKWINENGKDFIIDKFEKVPTVKEAGGAKKGGNAGYEYFRKDCARCHVWTKGRDRRGDYRGRGCSSCHVTYTNNALYEGNDPTISKDEVGHPTKHKITVKIPSATCAHCHNRGKRIGMSYFGVMEFPYGTPFDAEGNLQDKLHSKNYIYVKEGTHKEAGMECIDCHSSIDMHGDGNIYGTTLHAVEEECTDCHGTVNKSPWELNGIDENKLLTSRGNPYSNVIKKDNKVIVKSKVTDKTWEAPVINNIAQGDEWGSQSGKVAMQTVKKHNDRMECYTCHSTWAPQCYGCHVKIDYSGDSKKRDWVASVQKANEKGLEDKVRTSGSAKEGRSYLRWENPPLGINNEGQISPFIPGCQVIASLIDEDGNMVYSNKIFKTAEGINGLAMNPAAPHTETKAARTCESCHGDSKTLGYGLYNDLYNNMSKTITADVEGFESTSIQIPGVAQFPHDLGTMITRDGKQVQTDSHEVARFLNQEERSSIEKVGSCIGCHQHMDEEFWSKAAQTLGDTGTAKEHLQVVSNIMQDQKPEEKGIASSLGWLLGGLGLIIAFIIFYRTRTKID